MDLEDLVDKYKAIKIKYRILILTVVSVLPPLYYSSEESADLTNILISRQDERARKQERLDEMKGKAAQLPAFQNQINEITSELNKARKILPDTIQIDKILSKLGQFERETGVQITKFEPMGNVFQNSSLSYSEFPVQLTLKATFTEIMIFFDRILHMETLTHLRSIEFKRIRENQIDNQDENFVPLETTIESTSRLILYKGI